MVLKNSLNMVSEFFFLILHKFRNFYLNSSIYNKRISKTDDNTLNYKPSAGILNCIIKYKNKPYNIDDYSFNSVWKNKNIDKNEYRKLHSFFWLFVLNLKSSKKVTQSVLSNWIDENINYNPMNWEVDTLSKRVIAWISNSKLTYEESEEDYKIKFNFIIKKQVNHLLNEIDRSEIISDKMIGCTAIILSGLSYQDEKYLNYGLNLLKKICISVFDGNGFTKSRNFRQLVFYFKYLILIREFLKDSQTNVPEYLDEKIFYAGQAYNLIWQTTKNSYLFNGNHEDNYDELDSYLDQKGYKFKSNNFEIGGYTLLKNKNVSLMMDVGPSPERKFSNNFQSGALSFEMFYNKEKIISNSGFFQASTHQLNKISRSSASHSTLVIDNSSICKFKKGNEGDYTIEGSFKILSKNVTYKKDFWSVKAAHNGYQKKYNIIHQRELEFYPEKNLLKGKDTLVRKKNFREVNFDIRFHLKPGTKITKTQNQSIILIEFENSGWKFFSENYLIDIETGLYFGNKNKFSENQNFYISGNIKNDKETVNWELVKI